jgi:hypothetical protein
MKADTDVDDPAIAEPRGLGRLTWVLAGSALFGSLALVLWNRRALHSLREAAEHPVEPSHMRDDDGIY